MFPLYWEDLTDEQKEEHVITISAVSQTPLHSNYHVTFTPTPDMYAFGENETEKGETNTIGMDSEVDADSVKLVAELGVSTTLDDLLDEDVAFTVMLEITGVPASDDEQEH